MKKKLKYTSGSIIWSLDSKSFFYTPLDKYHRSKKIYKHILGTPSKEDQLIYEEKDDSFSVSISLTSDEKFFVISTSDSNTVEEYFFYQKDVKLYLNYLKSRKRNKIFNR